MGNRHSIKLTDKSIQELLPNDLEQKTKIGQSSK